MTEADVEANGAPLPRLAPVVTGFEILELTDQDELGLRYRARELSTELRRTVRVIATRLTPRQEDDLQSLWETQLHRPLDLALATVVAHGKTEDAARWVATDEDMDASLASQLATGERPTPLEVERIAALAARALQALHDNGLVHGGISPGAIVKEGESWRLTDVGIAAITSPIRHEGTDAVPGEVTAHAAPEVLAGALPTPAADIYAFGATMAEALTGRPLMPWEPGETADALLRRHLTADLVFPHDLESPALCGLIRAACQTDPARRPTSAELRELLRTSTADTAAADKAPIRVTDDDVQFTVYRPHAVNPEQWYTMIAFAHKTDPSDPDFGPPDPLQEVKRQAKAVLSVDLGRYVTAVEDSASIVERGSEITFVPQMEGVEFNPPHSSFQWVEAVHREEFRLRAAGSLDGRRARGRLSVFVGNLLVADVNLTMRVDSSNSADAPVAELEPQTARPYRKIFASYSHRDDAIVRHMGMLVKSLGDEFVRDCSHLRAGEVWSDQLEELIGQADVFQLFWSTNSMTSRFVRQEWEYALSLDRAYFVRPCYWEEPLPARPEENLPPETLQRLHFQQLAFAPASQSTMAAPTSVAKNRTRPTAGPSPAPLPASQAAPSVPPVGSPQPPSPAGSRRRRTAALAGIGGAAVLVMALAVGQSMNGAGRNHVTASPEPPATHYPPGSGGGPPSDGSSGATAGNSSELRLDDLTGKLSAVYSEEGGAFLRPEVARCNVGDARACRVVLDTLKDRCTGGSGSACDALWEVSPKGSTDWVYGATCGARVSETFAGRCADQ